ncbi:MAG: hypothetical protein EU529_07745 [Promethearchaeota archaeon]|nr:MAG: hypothetical protein EU529_07745 [Candidatus Lokiarchaeota archaeon]
MTNQFITVLNGLSALVLVCIALLVAIVFLRFYFQNKNWYLLFITLLMIALAIGYFGITLSFLSVVIYGDNLLGLKELVPFFTYSTLPIGCFAIIFMVWDLAGEHEYKRNAIIGQILYSIVYYIVLFITFKEAIICPNVPTGEIYDDWIIPNSIFYYIFLAGILYTTIFTIIGFNKIRKATSGELLKRFMWLFFAPPFMALGILLETLVFMELHRNFLYISRILVILSIILIYIGTRPPKGEIVDPNFIKKGHLDNEKILIIEKMFASKPEKITKEEVKFYKEQTICLVCKKEETGFINLFICPECKALYCEKCARALIEIENICWACNGAIDQSKPIKLIEREIEEDKKHKFSKEPQIKKA